MLRTLDDRYVVSAQQMFIIEDLDEALEIYQDIIADNPDEPPCCDAEWVEATEEAANYMDSRGLGG